MSQTDPSKIDLTRHAVIAASAGTGKTFTIEQLVHRLIVEKNVPIGQILVVTFTEKATGDLKLRLRNRLEHELAQATDKDRLIAALDGFDEAPIFTIHGFCQRMLRLFAFENREPLATELVDDEPLYLSALREQQRREWAAQPPGEFADFLLASGYPGCDSRGGSNWESNVLDLADRYRPAAGDQLLPAPAASLSECVGQHRQQCAAIVAEIRQLLGPDPRQFLERYERLPGRSDSRQKRAPIMRAVIALFSAAVEPGAAAWQRLVADAKSGFKSFKTFSQLAELARDQKWDELNQLVAALDRLNDKLTCSSTLAAFTISRLRADIALTKEQRAQISFDDMIVRLRDALDPSRNAAADILRDELRQRYRYALVDEFQDTDEIQWEIFRRIFVGQGHHRLLVIGDPKQAIYSFRGADLPTYDRAITELEDRHGAPEYPLDVNWRSTKEIIEPLNHLFSTDDWFRPGTTKYRAVQPAPENERTRIVDDLTGYPGVTALDVSKVNNVDNQVRAFATFTASEIKRLLNADVSLLKFRKRDSDPRPLKPNDICILIERYRDAPIIEAALRKQGIPFSFYKQPGIWQSVEALHVLYVLQALAHPTDESARRKALLTHFFASRPSATAQPIAPQDLARDSAFGSAHPAAQRLADWRALALKRQWAGLFQALASGGLFLDAIRDNAGGERRIANFNQIFEQLQRQAVAGAMDIADLAAHVAAYRHEHVPVEEPDRLLVLESDEPKVLILTAHKSKGLEFPVVFVAAGFGQPPRSPAAYEFHDSSNADRRTFDLTLNLANKLAHDQERDDESARLFYVALTRAMIKLYVPYGGSKGLGIARLTKAWDAANLDSAVAKKLECDKDGNPPAPPEAAGGVGGSPESVPPSPALVPLPPIAQILPATITVGRNRSVRLFSFTGLTRRDDPAAPPGPITLDDRRPDPAADDEQHAATEVAPARDDLPGGVEAGNLLHRVLQRIDFAAVRAAATAEDLLDGPSASLIAAEVDRYAASAARRPASQRTDIQSLRRAVATMVFAVLRAPLPENVGRICDLPPGDCLREMEFHLHVGSLAPSLPAMESVRATADGFLTGQIDLVFRRANRCFIVDYKSNWLPGGYDKQTVENEMTLHQYFLQRAIYAAAVTRWLGTQKIAKDSPHLAGAFYLFIRGIAQSGGGAAIDFHRYQSDADAVAEFDRLVSSRLAEQLVGR